jgi:hypothetical protein
MRSHFLRRKTARSFASVALSAGLLGGMLGVSSVATSATPAGAVGLTHRLVVPYLLSGGGPAFEKAARVTLVCNDVTGVATISVKNVSIITGNETVGYSRWGSLYVQFNMQADSGASYWYSIPVKLKQNTTNGLFGYGPVKGSVPTAVCKTGAIFIVQDVNVDESTTPPSFVSYAGQWAVLATLT